MKKIVSFFKFKKFKYLFKKFNYDVNQVIGMQEDSLYILFANKKLIRIYRDEIKPSPLISSYLSIEDAIHFNFQVEKNIIKKLANESEIKEYIEMQVYENGALKEAEEYEIKYSLIEDEENDELYNVETVIVSKSAIEDKFADIANKIGYLDYISFPAFSYRALYEAEILKEVNDLFIVVLDDKMFLTYYSKGKLTKIFTYSGGLDNIYETLANELKIKNFDKEVFIKLLMKKGFDQDKYSIQEQRVYETLKEIFLKKFNSIPLKNVERVFITTKYGNIEQLAEMLDKTVSQDIFDFQFYEDYNLDKLLINPFLFLSMLEAHIAYKKDEQDYNFSYYLRSPTFFYRPSGQFTLVFVFSLILVSAYPLFLFTKTLMLKSENQKLSYENKKLTHNLNNLNSSFEKILKEGKSLKAHQSNLKKHIGALNKFINEVYKFKYSYFPVSKTLVDITKIMNKHNVLLSKLEYTNNMYVLYVKADYDFQIPNFIYDLNTNHFKVYTDKIEKVKNRYISIIRIIE